MRGQRGVGSLDQRGDEFVLVVQTPAGPQEYDVTQHARQRIHGAINEKLAQVESVARSLPLEEIDMSEFVAMIRGLREDPGL